VELSARFEDALVYATRMHAGQHRKGTTVPYVAHVLAVAGTVMEHGGDEDEAIAALLHDGPEDQGGWARLDEIRQRFGDRVAAIVEECTDSMEEPKPEWRGRKERYVAKLSGASHSAQLVAAADKLHNMRAILLDLRTLGDALWTRFHAEKEGVVWYYQALADALRAQGTSPLVDELQRTVDAFVAMAGRPRSKR
jgi:(p)ppGpp synthase/HD superfamily hydrolase